MSEYEKNPYAPPTGESYAAEKGLRQRSVILMILLTVLTLGLYKDGEDHVRLGLPMRNPSETPAASFEFLAGESTDKRDS